MIQLHECASYHGFLRVQVHTGSKKKSSSQGLFPGSWAGQGPGNEVAKKHLETIYPFPKGGCYIVFVISDLTNR